MKTSQVILAVAILVLFLLWRRARAQVAQARSELERHRERNTFTFELRDDAGGPRLIVLDAEEREVDPALLDWSDQGLEPVRARSAGQVRAGMPVELVEEDDGLVVRDRTMTERLATLEAEAEGAVRGRLAAGEVGGCVVLRGADGAGEPLTLLLIHAGVDVEL